MKEATIKVHGCHDCPHCVWEPDDSCSNRAGVSVCRLLGDRYISGEKKPKMIPEWCSLEFSTVRDWIGK